MCYIIAGAMRAKKILLLLILALYLLPISDVYADWIDPRSPQFRNPYRSTNPLFFPLCPRPRGATKAFYATGTHGIVGDQTTYYGADIVYDMNNNNYVQCYCPTDGKNGIQTNWLATSNINQNTTQQLVGQGWYLVNNGADWGLSNEPYLAKNSDFLCLRTLTDFNSR